MAKLGERQKNARSPLAGSIRQKLALKSNVHFAASASPTCGIHNW
jgi:hypothetical protein